jgi:putative sigma-54 modulation protein
MSGKSSKSKVGAKRLSARRKTQPEIVVTFRHVDPTAALTAYAQRKLGHIAKFASRPCQIHLIVSVDKYRHRAEVTVRSGRWSVTAVEESKDLYAAIDLLADNAGRQLKKQIEKLKTTHTRTLSAGQVMSTAEKI